MNAPFWQSLVGCAVFAVSTFSNAALVSYDLDQSNMLPDGPAYLRVTIDDEGIAGRINFRISVLGPLMQAANRNVGIDEFGFNSAVALSAAPIVGLPIGWNYNGDETVGGFGRFEASVEAKSPSARVESLSFSITGLGMDTISSYLEESSGHARDGNFFFAARVSGLDSRSTRRRDKDGHREDQHRDNRNGEEQNDKNGYGEEGHGENRHGENRHGRDGYFAGGQPRPPSIVPVPASAWLLLAGIGVFAFASRGPRAAFRAVFASRRRPPRMPM